MNTLLNKTARIVLAVDPNVWIGADNRDDCAVKPVITDGDMRNWSGKDGCLVLDDIWYCGYEGGKVVVRLEPDNCTKWHILVVGPGVYRIELPGPGRTVAWTAGFEPKTYVTLVPVGSVDPKYQEFRIIFEE